MCFKTVKAVTPEVVSVPVPSNVVAVDGLKTVTVTRNGETVKVVTGRSTGRKDTFTLSLSAAAQLATALQNA